MFVAGYVPVWWVEEEEGVGPVVLGDEFAEISALYLDVYKALPGVFYGGLQSEEKCVFS